MAYLLSFVRCVPSQIRNETAAFESTRENPERAQSGDMSGIRNEAAAFESVRENPKMPQFSDISWN